jgi:hypothetical protein
MDDIGDLPDFQASLGAGATQFYAPFGGGEFLVLPAGAVLAVVSGQPGLALSLVRRPDQPGSTGNYAMLDIQITENFPLDAALSLARGLSSGATVRPISIDLGFARLIPGGPGIVLPPEMTAPTPLGWATSEGARWTHNLDVSTGELIKGAILGGALLFTARIEFSIRGVAPRAPAVADFVPADLLAALLSGRPDGLIAAPELVERLQDPALPLGVEGGVARDRVSQILADRLAAAYGSLVPAPAATDPPYFRLAKPSSAERVRWDLGTPTAVSRAFVLQVDPLSGLRPAADLAALIHEVTIPPLDLGMREIVATANLPPNRVGLPAVGARVSLPPAPPGRPSGIDKTAMFTPPDDQARIELQIDPDEALDYSVTGFAIIAAGSSIYQLEAEPRQASGEWLRVQGSDLPVTFAHLTASDRMMKQASVSGALKYSYAGKQATQPIALSAGAADVAVAVPTGAENASVTLTATTASGQSISLNPLRPGVIRLDLASFPGYGPHRVPVTCRFNGGESPIEIELESEDGSTQGSVSLAPSAPTAEWGYVAGSPFCPGYRYRVRGGGWSNVLDPGPLGLLPDGTPMKNSEPPNDQDSESAPVSFDIEGVHVAARPGDPSTLLYLPATPAPELDTSSKPTLSILKMPQSTVLQLGARFALPPNGEAALLRTIAAQYPALAQAKLQPAQVKVTKAAVLLADEKGSTAELATSPSSAFPPYTAIFSIKLSPAQAAQAISGVGGRRGVLFVDYTIVPAGADTPQVKRCDIATWFAGIDGLTHVRALG